MGIAFSSGILATVMRASAALVVTQPTASTIVAAGDDYATQVLGNAWDMNDSIDMDTELSHDVTAQIFSDGTFSSESINNDPSDPNDAYIFPLFMGIGSSINLSRGARFPIDTSHYRYATIKMRSNATQPLQVFFYQNTDAAVFGESNFFYFLANQWSTVTIDMISNILPSSPHQWTDFPQVTGLRIDPNAAAGVSFDIDWIRLTAPATTAQKTTVQWTDTGSSTTYSITAIDSEGISYLLGSGISGTSYLADTSFLAPGNYQIQVTRAAGGTANSSIFRINIPPQVAMTSPSVRGEQSQNFAQVVAGNPWGPLDATDFSTNGGMTLNGVINFKNVVYNNPTGSFYGRPTSLDPNLFFNLHGHTIDTSLYRSLCFSQEILGARNIGAGSVARIFWGNSTGALTTSDDIVLDDNVGDTVVSEYCIPDLAAANVIDPSAPPNGGTWSGTKSVFRLDPDEFTPPNGCSTPDTCHDVRLDSVVLSPFAHANPNYTFTWTLSVGDEIFRNGFEAGSGSIMLSLALDPDMTPGNGNEIAITTMPVALGNGSFAWPGSGAVAAGTYHVLVTVNDGVNVVNQYAGGVIVVNMP